MTSLEKMKLRIGLNSLREERINSSKNYIDNHFQDDPTYQENGIEILNGNIIYPRLFNYSKEENLSPTLEIQTQLCDEFKRGQLLKISDQYWLCLKSYCFNEMYFIGKLKQCTHLLKWQDVKTNEIKTSWAVLERPYSRTLNDGKVVAVSEMEFKARMPFDENTERINLDKRILTGTEYDKNGNMIGSVYKITGRDASSQVINGVGFLILNMTQDVFDKDKDNIELGICDYIEPNASPLPPIEPDPALLKCEIVGRDSIKIGGSARPYTAKFYKADGITEILDGLVNAKWDISLPDKFEKYFEITQNDNSILIKALNCEGLLNENIIIRLKDENGLYNQCEMIVDLVVI